MIILFQNSSIKVLKCTREIIMRILVVEDQQNHREEAARILTEAGVEVIVADDFREGMRILIDDHLLNGVISDIFMPEDTYEYRMALETAKDTPDFFSKRKRERLELQPRGLGLALLADRLMIPFVLCTSGYHHGVKYNWIHGLFGQFGWWDRIVDRPPANFSDMSENPDESKDWLRALEVVQKQKS